MLNTFKNSLKGRISREGEDGFNLARSIKMSSGVTGLKEDHLWLGGLMWAQLHIKDW